jgi:hypothetical protein
LCGFRTEFAALYQPDPAEDAATTAAAAFDLKPYLDHPAEFFTYLSNGETPLGLKGLSLILIRLDEAGHEGSEILEQPNPCLRLPNAQPLSPPPTPRRLKERALGGRRR